MQLIDDFVLINIYYIIEGHIVVKRIFETQIYQSLH